MQAKQAEVQALQQKIRTAMDLEPNHEVAFVELHDALSCLLFHGAALPLTLHMQKLACLC